MPDQIKLNRASKVRTRTKIVWRGFVLRIVGLLLSAALCYGCYFGFKLFQLQSKITTFAVIQNGGEKTEKKGFLETAKTIVKNEKTTLRGEQKERINILLLGMGGEGHKGKDLTDTIMLVSINPKTYQSSMLSIPRDLYVEIPYSKGAHTKINAVYAFEKKNEKSSEGESFGSIKEVVKSVTGQEVHYYLALNFDGFKSIIDELGGIDLEVEHDIYDSRYPGPNYSYETFEISKGHHHLDAETALKYARVRHTKGGDFGRASRQQQVIAAAKRKAFSLKTIANPTKIASIMNILGDNLKTDIQLAEIPSFIHLAKNINIYQTTTKVLDAWSSDSLLGSTHVEMGGIQAYVLIPRVKNYSQIYELSENIFQLGKIEEKSKQIKNEDASIVAISKTNNLGKLGSIFRKIGHPVTLRRSLPDFECDQNQDTITSLSEEPKLFTLDDLAAKLEAQVQYQANPDINFDIAICLSEASARYFVKQFEKEAELKSELLEQAIISEDGSVLHSKETN